MNKTQIKYAERRMAQMVRDAIGDMPEFQSNYPRWLDNYVAKGGSISFNSAADLRDKAVEAACGSSYGSSIRLTELVRQPSAFENERKQFSVDMTAWKIKAEKADQVLQEATDSMNLDGADTDVLSNFAKELALALK